MVLFISSQGKVNSRDEYLLLPSNFDSRYEEETSINFKEDILNKLRMVDGKILVFIDACHSGSAFSRSYSDAAASQVMDGLIKATSGLEIIASCSANEYSYEEEKWGNGAFTKAILEEFKKGMVDVKGGKIQADIYDEISGLKRSGSDGVITIEELKRFIQKRVPYLVKTTKSSPPTGQHPSNKSTEVLPEDMGIFMVINEN